MKVTIRFRNPRFKTVQVVEPRELTNAEKEKLLEYAVQDWIEDYVTYCLPRPTPETINEMIHAAVSEFNLRDHSR